MLLQLLANAVVTGCEYALLALGLALIYGTTRVFNLAYGATCTVGAYLTYVSVVTLGLPLVPSILGALALTMLLAAIFECVLFGPLARTHASQEILLLTALGLHAALTGTLSLFFGQTTRVTLLGKPLTEQLGSIILTYPQLSQAIVASALCSAALIALRRTHVGRSLRAVRDNSELASAAGVNVPALRILASALGTGLGALSVVLGSLDRGTTPNQGFAFVLAAATGMILGGAKSFSAATSGGLILGIVHSAVLWFGSTRWSSLITFSILITVLVVRPAGLLSPRRRLEDPES